MPNEHIKDMLVTLKEYHQSSLSLTFRDNEETAILSVRYHNNKYEITHLKNNFIESFDNIELLYIAIDEVTTHELQKNL